MTSADMTTDVDDDDTRPPARKGSNRKSFGPDLELLTTQLDDLREQNLASCERLGRLIIKSSLNLEVTNLAVSLRLNYCFSRCCCARVFIHFVLLAGIIHLFLRITEVDLTLSIKYSQP